jgi:hypothetical protein
MNRLWLRVLAVLVLWLAASAALFQATIHFPFFYGSGWFYVACAACGTLGLIIGKADRVATLMMAPLLPVGSLLLVSVLRLGYFGL